MSVEVLKHIGLFWEDFIMWKKCQFHPYWPIIRCNETLKSKQTISAVSLLQIVLPLLAIVINIIHYNRAGNLSTFLLSCFLTCCKQTRLLPYLKYWLVLFNSLIYIMSNHWNVRWVRFGSNYFYCKTLVCSLIFCKMHHHIPGNSGCFGSWVYIKAVLVWLVSVSHSLSIISNVASHLNTKFSA